MALFVLVAGKDEADRDISGGGTLYPDPADWKSLLLTVCFDCLDSHSDSSN